MRELGSPAMRPYSAAGRYGALVLAMGLVVAAPTVTCMLRAGDEPEHGVSRGTLVLEREVTAAVDSPADAALLANQVTAEDLPAQETPNERELVQELGELTGRFVFDGPPPAPSDLWPGLSNVDKNLPQRPGPDGRYSGVEFTYREFLGHGIRPKTEDASLLVAEDGGIANVVVWVNSKDIPWAPPQGERPPASIRLMDGAWSPRISLVTAGQSLLVENHDPVAFNFHLELTLNSGANLLLPARSEEQPRRLAFEHAERHPAQYRSDIGPWATGWLFVHGNPFMAVSRPDGSFTLPNLPPGEWEFRAWHERQGYVRHWPKGLFKQTIEPGANSLGTIKLKPELFDKKPAAGAAAR